MDDPRTVLRDPESIVDPYAIRPAAVVPSVNALDAIRRNLLLAIGPILLCVAAAVAVGLARTPVYEAEARLAIGGIDFTAPGALSGFATASEALASTYSRAIDAQVVRDAAGEAVNGFDSADGLTASPLPESPVIRVFGTSSDEERAVTLANAAAAALLEYADTFNDAGGEGEDRFFDAYQEAATAVQQAQVRRDAAQAVFDRDPSRVNRRALVGARTELVTAELREQAAAQNYIAATGSRVAVAQVQELSRARTATSDRGSRIQIYVVVGLLVGGLIGAALAVFRANAVLRRRVIRDLAR